MTIEFVGDIKQEECGLSGRESGKFRADRKDAPFIGGRSDKMLTDAICAEGRAPSQCGPFPKSIRRSRSLRIWNKLNSAPRRCADWRSITRQLSCYGGADILVCPRIREWRDILVPPERIRVRSGGKNATTCSLDG